MNSELTPFTKKKKKKKKNIFGQIIVCAHFDQI